MSTPEDNERMAREHFLRLFNEETVDRAVLAEGFRLHANSHEPRTPEEQLRAIAAYREAFPDLEATVEDSFATPDRAALRTTVTGTHRGEFVGLAPTGTTVEIPSLAVYRIEEGLLAEAWHVADNAGLRGQVERAAGE